MTQMARKQPYDPNEKNDRIDTMGSNVYSAKDNQSLHKSLNGEFFLYQILLQQILDEQNATNNQHSSLAEYFQPIDKKDQQTMHEFDTQYRPDKSIHWYTRETCIYKILNKALRTQDIDDIMPFDQFIRDLNKQLAKERVAFVKQRQTTKIRVFRGQFISKDEVNRLKSAKGQLLAMNSFLSTSTNYEKAFEFATSRPPPNDKLTSILLEIDVDLLSDSRPYADIRHLSAFAEEEEILFMFGCIFRIEEFFYDDKKKLWLAFLKLCSHEDPDYKEFDKNINNETSGQSQFISLGNCLIDMQKYDEAERHFQRILQQNLAKNDLERAYCHHGLAQIYMKKQNFQLAIESIEKVLSYILKDPSHQHDHPLISQCYNNLASIYAEQEDYPMALQFYEKALETKNNNTIQTYSDLANVHSRLGNNVLALDYLNLALQHRGSAGDSAIANVFIQMGNILAKLNRKNQAAQMFERAEKLQLKTLSPDHPDLSYTYLAWSDMALQMNDNRRALHYLDRAYQIQSHSLPDTHSDFAEVYTKYGHFYEKQRDFARALVYYQKALDNQLKTLSSSHPSVSQTYLIMGLVHKKLINYPQTLSCFDKVLQNELERKKPGDSSLTAAFKRMADLHFELTNLDQALHFYLQALNNELNSKSYDDSSLVSLYQVIADIFHRKNVLDQALLYSNRLLDCYLRQQSKNNESIKQTYSLIGDIYSKKTNVDPTFLFYHKLEVHSSKDIENIYFEKRHLDLTLNYFEDILQQTTNSNSQHIREIISNIRQEKERALQFRQ